MKNQTRILVSLTVCLMSFIGSASAQMEGVPNWDWQEIETDHFRIFFPKPFEEWTAAIASRFESIHTEVVSVVGYAPERKVDILVMDPMGMSNGMALPLIDSPRIVLWASAPDASSSLAGYTDWGELVGSHEYAHIVHLIRPSRNPIDRLVAKLLPIGSIALKSPAWVTEGYAVILEGKLTGSGRPFTSFRSAILRQWAIEGRLPEYRALNGSDTWMGYSMPYLAGSAFLEWLEKESGDPEVFTKLWRRLTARQRRSFDEAFEGLFGDSAETLYNRFRAELTAAALGIEAEMTGRTVTGELFQSASESDDPPDVSPDGKKLVMVTRNHLSPPRLVVLSLSDVSDAETKKQEKIRKMMEKDPEDVPDRTTKPPAHKEIASFPSYYGISPNEPRWTADGESVMFHAHVRDSEGTLHPDLFQWFPDTGSYRRLTERADVRQADPSPNGEWVAAIRQQYGRSGLVRISMKDGTIDPLIPPSLEHVLSTPRFSPDGRFIAVIESSKVACRLLLVDPVSGDRREITAGPRENLMHPEWVTNDRLLIVTDRSGVPNIESINLAEEATRTQMTCVAGGAMWPTYNPSNGSVFFLNLTSKGLEIRQLGPDSNMNVTAQYPREAWVMPPVDFPPLKEHHIGVFESRPFRTLARQEFKTLIGGTWMPSGDSMEIGVRSGDIVGRLDAIALGSLGWNGGSDGGTLGVMYRGFPVALGVQGFFSKRSFTDQRDASPVAETMPDLTRSAVQFTAEKISWWRRGSMSAEFGALIERIEPENSNMDFDRRLISTRLGMDGIWRFGSIAAGAGFDAAAQAGWMESQDYTQFIGHIKTLIQSPQSGYLRFDWFEGRSQGDPCCLNRFSLGGGFNSLESSVDIRNELLAPYLPAFSYSGNSVRRLRIEAGLPGTSPFVLFAERTDLQDGSPDTGRMRAAGIELAADMPPMPIVKFPEIRMRAGLARLFDGNFKDKWRGYVCLSYKP